MTDKQIIIDGIDVSGCRCLAYPEADNPMCTGLFLGCKNNNCEYKKWKRKEQELEQYKKSKQASYEQLQKRCNELELGIRKLQKQFGIEILYCKTTGESTFRSTEILKLKQTLTEIKEIAEDQKDVLESMRIDIAEQILNKISEVLDENI